jgi:hypothetical protein
MAGDSVKLGVDRQLQSSVTTTLIRRLFFEVSQHYQG